MPSVEELPLTGYVGLIVFCAPSSSLLRGGRPDESWAVTATLFPPLRPLTAFRLATLVLTVASLALTWSQMILYLVKSYHDSAARAGVALDDWSAKRWLGLTDLFDEAWGYVCATPQRWWWSSQICLETVGVWLPFLWSEGPVSPPLVGACFLA